MAPESGSGVRLGFACSWDDPPERTWSYTPWMLREALRATTDLHELDLQPTPRQRTLLDLAFRHLNPRRPPGGWRYARLNETRAERLLRRAVGSTDLDAVLQISDLALLDEPFFLYQDLSWDLLLNYRETLGLPMLGIAHVRRATMLRRYERQHRFYDAAAGVFCMSQWLADHLLETGSVDASRLHVVYAGTSATAPPVSVERRAPAARLLFIGRHFHRKGGDLVVRALARIRRDHDPDVRLTVVGPDRWPLPGPVPDGVDFLGRIPAEQVARLWHEHDVFVMPSRFEPFGIVLAEAASAGLPVVARNEFAMPELVRHGQTGYLVDGDDPDDLADRLVAVLQDPAMRQRCRDLAPHAQEMFSWTAVADRMTAVIAAAADAAPRA